MFIFFKVLRNPSRMKNLCLLLFSLLFFYVVFFLHPHDPSPSSAFHLLTDPSTTTVSSASSTAIRHLFFSIAASSVSFPNRKSYLRLWYRPSPGSNSIRAAVFLDRPSTTVNDPTLPPFILSGSISRFPYSFPGGSRAAIRIARIVKEAVDLNVSGVRWYVFGDDDTVFIADNLAATLSKYDHNEWYYVGSSSESYEQNLINSFDMAFGGGGFAISSSLASVLSRVIDSCLMRYPHLYGSDSRVFSCLAELGVGLTHERGFHQVDVRGDISGMLLGHPLSPLLSLHHLDSVNPIFPNMTRSEAIEHLFKGVNVDPGSVLQQTVCYDRSNSLTILVSWGYSVHVFDGNVLLPKLLHLRRTFRPWRRNRSFTSNLYMFNTVDDFPSDPCLRPAVFFMRSVSLDLGSVSSVYTRYNIGNCSIRRKIDGLERLRVVSQSGHRVIKPFRRKCCDVLSSRSRKSKVVHIRECAEEEIIAMHV